MGSVIGYKSCGQHILHRVIKIRDVDGQPHYLTKGDSNLEPDGCSYPLITVTQLLMRVERNKAPQNAHFRYKVNLARDEMLANPDERKRYIFWRDTAASAAGK